MDKSSKIMDEMASIQMKNLPKFQQIKKIYILPHGRFKLVSIFEKRKGG
jgi:hypothetical protein